MEAYNIKSFFFSGVKTLWLVQSNETVLTVINNVKHKKEPPQLLTYYR